MAGGLIGGAISGAGSVIGGKNSSKAAKDAARIQAEAARYAADLQKQAFDYTSEKLEPYVGVGNELINPYLNASQNLYEDQDKYLNPLLGKVHALSPFDRTLQPTTADTIPDSFDYQTRVGKLDQFGLGADQQAALEQTPGYQFTLNQGLKAVQNSEAAKGRGISGNAITGAEKYATGLADKTFKDQYGMAADQFKNAMVGQDTSFNQTLKGQSQQAVQDLGYYDTYLSSVLKPEQQLYQQTSANIYNPLSELRSGITIGGNAAARVGNAAQSAANTAGNYYNQAGASSASGIIGSQNAMNSGWGNATNTLSNYLTGNSLTGGATGGSSITDFINNLFSPSSGGYTGGGPSAYGYGPNDYGGGGYY